MPGRKDEDSMGAIAVEVVAESLSNIVPGCAGHSVDAFLLSAGEMERNQGLGHPPASA